MGSADEREGRLIEIDGTGAGTRSNGARFARQPSRANRIYTETGDLKTISHESKSKDTWRKSPIGIVPFQKKLLVSVRVANFISAWTKAKAKPTCSANRVPQMRCQSEGSVNAEECVVHSRLYQFGAENKKITKLWFPKNNTEGIHSPKRIRPTRHAVPPPTTYPPARNRIAQ